jgi:hypothetical protein
METRAALARIQEILRDDKESFIAQVGKGWRYCLKISSFFDLYCVLDR